VYQRYDTHYVDLWVGAPTSQRQMMIVLDIRLSVTSFPVHGVFVHPSHPRTILVHPSAQGKEEGGEGRVLNAEKCHGGDGREGRWRSRMDGEGRERQHAEKVRSDLIDDMTKIIAILQFILTFIVSILQKRK
jgi:hypothetical protein